MQTAFATFESVHFDGRSSVTVTFRYSERSTLSITMETKEFERMVSAPRVCIGEEPPKKIAAKKIDESTLLDQRDRLLELVTECIPSILSNSSMFFDDILLFKIDSIIAEIKGD